jgi:hypothetical protein
VARKKDQELRPVMTRVPEGLRRRLEREAKFRGRSMNAEIVKRLQESFDIPDQAGAIVEDVVSQIEDQLWGVYEDLRGIQSQNQAILSHLGLPDPVEEAKARKAAAREAQGNKEELERRLQEIERNFGRGSIMRTEPKEGEKK